jgi:hypothetical protein
VEIALRILRFGYMQGCSSGVLVLIDRMARKQPARGR